MTTTELEELCSGCVLSELPLCDILDCDSVAKLQAKFKAKVRADAIDECVEKLFEVTPLTLDKKLDTVFVNALRELKEQTDGRRTEETP